MTIMEIQEPKRQFFFSLLCFEIAQLILIYLSQIEPFHLKNIRQIVQYLLVSSDNFLNSLSINNLIVGTWEASLWLHV